MSSIDTNSLNTASQSLQAMAGGSIPQEDVHLFEYVSVKDLARFYESLGVYDAKDVWSVLKPKLVARQQKKEDEGKKPAAAGGEEDQDETQVVEDPSSTPDPDEEVEDQVQDDAERLEAERLEAKKLRREARRLAAQLEETERLEAEEREQRAARRAQKKEAILLEQERLAQVMAEETAADLARRNTRVKAQYVRTNPLDATTDGLNDQVEQVSKAHSLKPPPCHDEELMSRTYTPKCPSCQARFAKAPPGWDCPMCLRRTGKSVKCWQPDSEASKCGSCTHNVGRFSRHHCRNCGRVACGKCTEHKASIPALGFDSPVKVCTQCASTVAPVPQEAERSISTAQQPTAHNAKA